MMHQLSNRGKIISVLKHSSSGFSGGVNAFSLSLSALDVRRLWDKSVVGYLKIAHD